MASFFHNPLSFCAVLLVFLSLLVSPGSTANPPPKPRAVLLPVKKDAATNQYVTRLGLGTPLRTVSLVVDLGKRYTWIPCENGSYVSSTLRPIRCNTSTCPSSLFGCSGGDCAGFGDNPIIKLTNPADIKEDVVSLQSTDGQNPRSLVTAPHVGLACSFKDLLQGLAKGSFGMAGFSRNRIGLPVQISSALGFRNVNFAFCLPSSGARTDSAGVIFVGNVPAGYQFMPGAVVTPGSLVYAPLVTNPVSTAGVSLLGEPSYEYFIKVAGIKVNGKDLSTLNSSLLLINKKGNGGTKLSTVNPYTVLETSIYTALADAFTRESGLKKVAPVAPFSTCYDARSVSSTPIRPAVPPIELVFDGNKGTGWVIVGANSMVSVNPNVLCLGFVDGGNNPTTSIVIGGFQMEDNLLQFDLVRKTLGVSGSLYSRRTTCANFNFTAVTP